MRFRAVIVGLGAGVLVAAAVGMPGCASSGRGRAAATTVTVKMGEYFFRPPTIRVRVGQTVRFANTGRIQHTVADTDARHRLREGLIKPHPLNRGQSQLVRVSKPGTVYYLCTLHPTLMRGKIVVAR